MHFKTSGKILAAIIVCCMSATVSTASEAGYREAASKTMIDMAAFQPEQRFLKKAYKRFAYAPVWTGEEALTPLSLELFDTMAKDPTLDRSSRLYLDSLRVRELAYEKYTPESKLSEKVGFEIRIAKLYKAYADYTLYSDIDWERFLKKKKGWRVYKTKTDPAVLFETAVRSGSIKETLEKNEPVGYHYAALKEKLIEYLKLQEAGEWSPVTFEKTLRPGEVNATILSVRERLAATKEDNECNISETYDTCLQKAVEQFQARHGLKVDGIIGKNTIAAMNVSLAERIATIRLNLNRIKSFNRRDSGRHIIINIPAFTLYFEENGKLLKQMKVITGTRQNPTPIFSNSVQSIVFNPYWHVPKSIVRNEMIPKLLKNPQAMREEGIDIYAGSGVERHRVGGDAVDWGMYRYSGSIPFHFSQPPGETNPLGKIKFLFPNEFSVYMHDTPKKSLFDANIRAFSHGCIRLGEPVELLKIFSGFNHNVDFEKAKEVMQGNVKELVKLQNQVPIDVVYLTAWVDYDGVLQFRDDIYGYDAMQTKSSRKR